MLNMGSATRLEGSDRPRTSGAPGATDPDRTARARIRDAAIACFAAEGVARTTVRAVAEVAEVSPALVMHHFGSKQQLVAACDEHVAALVREQKQAAMAAGPDLDPLAALRAADDGPPLLAYLARTLIEGSPHVAALVDDLVHDAEGYLADGERSGVLRETDDRWGRAVVLTLWSLGALALHDHVRRLLGVDLTGPSAGLGPYLRAGAEILGAGVLTPEAATQVRTALDALQEERP
jgi:AcrR family transcriptional regulator